MTAEATPVLEIVSTEILYNTQTGNDRWYMDRADIAQTSHRLHWDIPETYKHRITVLDIHNGNEEFKFKKAQYDHGIACIKVRVYYDNNGTENSVDFDAGEVFASGNFGWTEPYVKNFYDFFPTTKTANATINGTNVTFTMLRGKITISSPITINSFRVNASGDGAACNINAYQSYTPTAASHLRNYPYGNFLNVIANSGYKVTGAYTPPGTIIPAPPAFLKIEITIAGDDNADGGQINVEFYTNDNTKIGNTEVFEMLF